MAEELKPYVHTVNGIEHTVLCTKEHAKLLGATPKDGKSAEKAQEPEDKARTPRNKSAE